MRKKLPLVARVLLGLIFFASGIVGLFNLVPPPENLPEDMVTFMNGMLAAKYFFPLVKGTEIVCGLLLVSGFFVPLALVILAPVILNIFLVHAFMAPDGIILALVLGGLEIYLAFFAEPYAPIVKQIFRCPKWEARG